MSRRGNCSDNAQAESFWSWLKTKLLSNYYTLPDLLQRGCLQGQATSLQ